LWRFKGPLLEGGFNRGENPVGFLIYPYLSGHFEEGARPLWAWKTHPSPGNIISLRGPGKKPPLEIYSFTEHEVHIYAAQGGGSTKTL